MGANSPQADRMRAQGYTEEEIEDMLKCDKEIDRGVDLFPLDPALEPGAKKARRADRTDTPKPAKRENKVDNEKRELIACFTESLADLRCCEGFDITELQVANPEREFSFTMNGKKYKVILSCPRSQGQDFLRLLLDMRQGAEVEYLSTFGKKIFQTFFNLPIDKSPVM